LFQLTKEYKLIEVKNSLQMRLAQNSKSGNRIQTSTAQGPCKKSSERKAFQSMQECKWTEVTKIQTLIYQESKSDIQTRMSRAKD
jgi:hypothetical protein